MLGDMRKLSSLQLCELVVLIGKRIKDQGYVITAYDANELMQIETEMLKRVEIERMIKLGSLEVGPDREGIA